MQLCSSQIARLLTWQLYNNRCSWEILFFFAFPNCITAFLLVFQMFHPLGWLRKRHTWGCPICSFHECRCFLLREAQRGAASPHLLNHFSSSWFIATSLSEVGVAFSYEHVDMALIQVITMCGYVIWATDAHASKTEACSKDACHSASKPSTALHFFSWYVVTLQPLSLLGFKEMYVSAPAFWSWENNVVI